MVRFLQFTVRQNPEIEKLFNKAVEMLGRYDYLVRLSKIYGEETK